MVTLADIRSDPDYLGNSTNWWEDVDLFEAAVGALMVDGLDEEAAVAIVWNDGDWITKADEILANFWT